MASRHRICLLCCAGALGMVAAACGPTQSASSRTPSTSPTASHGGTPSATATASGSPPFSPPPGGTTPSPGPANGTYTVRVSLSGTDTLQGSFTQAVAGGARCPVPSDLTGTVSGQHLDIQMPGAATGTGQPQQLSPGDLLVIVGANTWGVASASNAPHATTGTLQRSSDGGGSALFQNLALQSNPSQQPQESGSITWSCA